MNSQMSEITHMNCRRFKRYLSCGNLNYMNSSLALVGINFHYNVQIYKVKVRKLIDLMRKKGERGRALTHGSIHEQACYNKSKLTIKWSSTERECTINNHLCEYSHRVTKWWKTNLNVAKRDMRWLDLKTISQIVGPPLLHVDLVTTCGAHTQGKKWCVEAHSSEDDSGEIVVMHVEGLCGTMVVEIGVEMHRESGN